MSSIVCQGLQSCLQTPLIEPHILRHKLAPSESNSCQNGEENNKNGDFDLKDSDSSGWSLIQSITNTSQNPEEVTDPEKVYVHPLVKRSSSKLSEKSLEMCTESLGSETGSDISDEFTTYLPSVSLSKPRHFAKKLTHSCSFPPPLTSISGSDNVRVRPHREHGRLVLKAETVASNSGYLQAERVDGRLRLCMTIVSPVKCDHEDDDQMFDEQECYADDDNDKCVDDGNDNDQIGLGRVVRINGNSGSEFETGEIARPRRCKEGGGRGRKKMQSWGAVWVASS